MQMRGENFPAAWGEALKGETAQMQMLQSEV